MCLEPRNHRLIGLRKTVRDVGRTHGRWWSRVRSRNRVRGLQDFVPMTPERAVKAEVVEERSDAPDLPLSSGQRESDSLRERDAQESSRYSSCWSYCHPPELFVL